jgi:hypothetical protein
MILAHPTSTAMDIMALQFPHDRFALWWLEHPALASDELPLYPREVIPQQLTIIGL